MEVPKILLVDDEEAVCQAFGSLLDQHGYVVHTATSLDGGMAALQQGGWDLVLTDLYLGTASGFDLLKRARDLDPTLPVILFTGNARLDAAVDAMRHGARDFLTKPIAPDELLMRVETVLARREQLRDAKTRPKEAISPHREGLLLGHSRAIERVREQLSAVARPPVVVLLLGESGTGKEMAARTLHVLSPRCNGPFVPVNCGAIPEGLLENELFGHVKGAYTGAGSDGRGMFERADGGTLFLDEIGEMSPSLQVRLLRVIESGEFQRLGGGRSIQTNTRIVAATHRNLATMVREGKFREDLYYRINVVTIQLPTLRDRREDIAFLAEHFRTQYSVELGIPTGSFAPGALETLTAHDWPGNVRELANFIKRAVVLSHGSKVSADGLTPAPTALAGIDLTRPFTTLKKELIDRFEKAYLQQLLGMTNGNVAQAARLSGQYSKNLWEMCKKHSVDVEQYRGRSGSHEDPEAG